MNSKTLKSKPNLDSCNLQVAEDCKFFYNHGLWIFNPPTTYLYHMIKEKMFDWLSGMTYGLNFFLNTKKKQVGVTFTMLGIRLKSQQYGKLANPNSPLHIQNYKILNLSRYFLFSYFLLLQNFRSSEF